MAGVSPARLTQAGLLRVEAVAHGAFVWLVGLLQEDGELDRVGDVPREVYEGVEAREDCRGAERDGEGSCYQFVLGRSASARGRSGCGVG